TALCHDDHFEDTAGQCKALTAKEDLTLEAILAQYGEIISSDADDESVFYLTDPQEVPAGAIRPRHSTPSENSIARRDYGRTAGSTNEENTVAARIITLESLHKKSESMRTSMMLQRMAPLQRTLQRTRVYSPTKIAHWNKWQMRALLTAAQSRENTAGPSHMSARIMNPVPLVSSPDQDLWSGLCRNRPSSGGRFDYYSQTSAGPIRSTVECAGAQYSGRTGAGRLSAHC